MRGVNLSMTHVVKELTPVLPFEPAGNRTRGGKALRDRSNTNGARSSAGCAMAKVVAYIYGIRSPQFAPG